ncbi:aldehyde dehydrogenase [Paenibacillus provencensis]|uniref:Aldehyde dehydrogenase n=1 Tax=Paenibacillus provencensis TaxID=441151 RepID=A0ABW3PSC9_9BACL|nr:aldehyde dehydrogenase [Paenibacillus sp. MER 78]MCM3128387.1 aldehyde dehydrogenase [Paenibacillus sp. MER 78]
MNGINEIVQRQKDYYSSGATRRLEFRLEQLRLLREGIVRRKSEILEAVRIDLNKSEQEAIMTEYGILLEEIDFIKKRLKGWMKRKRVKTSLKTHIGSKGYIVAEPYGTTLIIAPWNYPFQLALSPLLGAIAAGNTAVIKPSELTPHVSAVLNSLIGELYDPAYITVVEGAVETSQELLRQPFDKIFFTGSVAVGKVVMKAAAEQLTPLTLELGGKSPCIIHQDAHVKLAAKRVAFGKVTNAGQTCIAPDYLLVHESVRDAFVEEYAKAIKSFYGKDPVEHTDYGRIVSPKHFERLKGFLQTGSIVLGGEVNEESLKIAPTILEGISWEDPVMQEEIFGPILPMMTYQHLDEVVHRVNARPKPLALYLFTENKMVQERIIEQISFGGGCINDTLMHVATPHLPFGGVGESGMGSYHGESSFAAFSHMKSVLKQTNKFDIKMKYPSKNNLKIIRKVMK